MNNTYVVILLLVLILAIDNNIQNNEQYLPNDSDLLIKNMNIDTDLLIDDTSIAYENQQLNIDIVYIDNIINDRID